MTLAENDKEVKSAEVQVRERGDKKRDVHTLNSIKHFVRTNRFLIHDLRENGFNANLDTIQFLLDDMRYRSDLVESYGILINHTIEEKNAANLILSLAMLETSIIDERVMEIGASDIAFNKLEVVFLPDQIMLGDEKLTGRLYLGAFASNLSDEVPMKINGRNLTVKDGVGMVDISKPGSYSAEIELGETSVSNSFEVKSTK